MILRGKDVAARPSDLCAQRHQRLDENRGLHRHVQGTGDPSAAQRLAVGELTPGRHQARHLMLGELDLLAAELGEG
jgi:hypothetical protein